MNDERLDPDLRRLLEGSAFHDLVTSIASLSRDSSVSAAPSTYLPMLRRIGIVPSEPELLEDISRRYDLPLRRLEEDTQKPTLSLQVKRKIRIRREVNNGASQTTDKGSNTADGGESS